MTPAHLNAFLAGACLTLAMVVSVNWLGTHDRPSCGPLKVGGHRFDLVTVDARVKVLCGRYRPIVRPAKGK